MFVLSPFRVPLGLGAAWQKNPDNRNPSAKVDWCKEKASNIRFLGFAQQGPIPGGFLQSQGNRRSSEEDVKMHVGSQLTVCLLMDIAPSRQPPLTVGLFKLDAYITWKVVSL